MTNIFQDPCAYMQGITVYCYLLFIEILKIRILSKNTIFLSILGKLFLTFLTFYFFQKSQK